MSATTATPLRRSARLAALASQKPASPVRTTSQEVPSAPKKVARDLSHLFTPAVPANLSIPITPAQPRRVDGMMKYKFVGASPADLKEVTAPKAATRTISHLFTPAIPETPVTVPVAPVQKVQKSTNNGVYRSIADKMFDATFSYRENLIRENIHNLIAQQLEAAQRCMPNPEANEQMLFEYSFIVAPLLDSLAKSYVEWDRVGVLDVYRVMYFWRPDARPASINWMSAEFLHNWNVCRDRILKYGLTFPSSKQ